MAERERRLARPNGRVFLPRSLVLSSEDLRRCLVRIAHEIVEHNRGTESLVIIGLQTGGVALAVRIVEELARFEPSPIPLGTLDVAFYRDDIGIRPVLPEEATAIPVELTGRDVVLVDDVLFTGRTVRAALDALSDHGRARTVQLAVAVDRGHRELPIRPDYVGKNLPTRRDEMVDVSLDGVWLGDLVEA